MKNANHWVFPFFIATIVGLISMFGRMIFDGYHMEITTIIIPASFMIPTSRVIYVLWQRIMLAEANASTDPLTGLLNRRGAEYAFDTERQMLLREQRRHQHQDASDKEMPISALMIDLDGFKSLNDREGHFAGDKAIRTMADLIRKTFPRHTDIVFRFGGDEFGIILPNTDAAHAARLAEELRKKAEVAYMHKCITLSIGVGSRMMSLGENIASEKILEGLIGAADWCLGYSKDNGKNQVTSARPIVGRFKE